MGRAAAAAPDKDAVRQKLEEYGRTHDARLRDEVVVETQGLAISLASRFFGRGEDRDDLVQIAMLGLSRAVDRFDPDRGIELTTFAAVTILGDLKRYFRDQSWQVRPPRRVHDLYLQSQRSLDELTHDLGRSPTMRELADDLGANIEEVVEALEAGGLRHLPSLDAPALAFHDDDAFDLDRRLGDIDPELELADGRAMLPALLRRLPAREQELVRLRFLEGLSQSEIARQLDVSQMQVSRMLTRTLARLRTWATEDE
jgi:RNA polymerase sigma-B factor